MKRGEARFRAALRGLRRPPRRVWWPQLTPAQWFRLMLLVLGIVAMLLGVKGEALVALLELLIG